jgi:hypothetical protein
VDSDFVADLDKRRFLTGYVFTAGGCVVSWKATLQLVHLLLVPTWIREGSSQVMAIVEVCKESVWLKDLYSELCGGDSCIKLF